MKNRRKITVVYKIKSGVQKENRKIGEFIKNKTFTRTDGFLSFNLKGPTKYEAQ